jgi:hypothetical protein
VAGSPSERFQTVAEFADALKHATTVDRKSKGTTARRTFLLGATAAAVLAAGLWLAWNRGRVPEGAVRGGRPTGVSASAPPKPVTARSAPPDTVPAGARPGSARVARPAETRPVASKAAPDTAAAGKPDTGIALSPFRRAHPWAAVPGGRFYFRSSCRLALRSNDLLYFGSEEEAQATGRSRSPEPGCS